MTVRACECVLSEGKGGKGMKEKENGIGNGLGRKQLPELEMKSVGVGLTTHRTKNSLQILATVPFSTAARLLEREGGKSFIFELLNHATPSMPLVNAFTCASLVLYHAIVHNYMLTQ